MSVTKVIFLDIDGPMISDRAMFLPGNRHKLAEWFDPLATLLLLDVIEKTGAALVISSTWATMGRDAVIELLNQNKVNPDFLHQDWMTPRKFSSNRETEIEWWLKKHPEITHYAILDDYYGIKSMKNSVYVSTQNGLLWQDYQKMLQLLGFEDKPDFSE